MDELERSIGIVEAAGYNVSDDRELAAYYGNQEARLRQLLNDARAGDWVAAEELLQKIAQRPGHTRFSRALSEFTQYIAIELLSPKDFTKARRGKRIKNPLLAAVLGTDGRKDYPLRRRKRALKHRLDCLEAEGVLNDFELEDRQSKRRALIEHVAATDSEGIQPDQLEEWLKLEGKKK